MPLDDTNWYRPCDDARLVNRKRLINALRDDPKPWNFCFPETCAMGLAVRLGIVSVASPSFLGTAIGIPDRMAGRLFIPSHWETNWPYRKRFLLLSKRVRYRDITPIMVADALEALEG